MEKFNHILITGATSGIGKALAHAFLAGGASVACCGRNETARAELKNRHRKANVLAFDVTDRAQTIGALQSYLKETPKLDLAILNAGDHKPTDGAAFRAEDYARLMDINYGGVLNSLEPIIAQMKEQRSGTIAIMGSVAGYTGLTHAGAYCATKAALMRLAETLHVELKAYGIDVKLISPGFVKTPLTDKNDFPMPFLLEPEEAVERIMKGLRSGKFQIAFPNRLAIMLRLLSALPEPLYFKALETMVKKERPQPSLDEPA